VSTHAVSPTGSIRTPSRSSTLWSARPFWAGMSIISMWLAVLFVGVYGGSIQSSTPGGTTSSVPVVVVVAGVAMIGTIVVGRRAFAASASEEDLRRALEDEVRARQQLATEVSELRAKLSS
jgi:hypothetical protein